MLTSLPNLIENNPADILLFHTGWSDSEIASLNVKLQRHLPTAKILCIATKDWQANRNFRPGETVQRAYQEAGYRSMCRWYGQKVSTLLSSSH